MQRLVRLAALALLLAACGDADDGGEEAVRAMVLETCAPGGETADPIERDVCLCAYETLRDRLDPGELERLDRRVRDDPENVPAELQEAVLDCAFDVVAPAEPKPSTTSTTSRSSSSSSSTSTSTTRP